MSVLAQPPPIPPVEREPTVTLKPSFWGAWRGIWLFTWRSQLTWRRLPNYLFGLLALPCLIYLTTRSQQAWSERRAILGNPAATAQQFAGTLARSRQKLTSDQVNQLMLIFTQEFTRADRESGAQPPTDDPEVLSRRQQDLARACYERIHNRVQDFLNERQLTEFDKFQKRKLLELQNRSNEPVWTRASPFYHLLVDFYFFVVLPLQCVASCGSLIREELQADTLGFLTTRPLSRARLLVAKYLAQTAWLQIVMLVETLLLLAAGQLRQIHGLGALLVLVLAVQILAVMAWGALGTLLGLVARRYMALALVYGFIVEMGIGRIPTNINTLSVIRHLKTLLAHNGALESLYGWSGTGVLLSLSALVVATVLFVGLAAVLFTFKEYHHTAEMQK